MEAGVSEEDPTVRKLIAKGTFSFYSARLGEFHGKRGRK